MAEPDNEALNPDKKRKVPLGTLEKKGYLTAINKAIDLDPFKLGTHPKHKGVKMQAHHVISAKGIKISGLGKKLVGAGYNINTLNNLVFIPSTLQGACHLGVQPHRSDHTALSTTEKDHDNHLLSYHKIVAKRIRELKRKLARACQGDNPRKSNAIIRKMGKIGLEILDGIQNTPASVPLTKVAAHFMPGKHGGCGGKDSIKSLRRFSNAAYPKCPVGRDHFHNQGPGQAEEDIAYKKGLPGSTSKIAAAVTPAYKLRMGR